jgi:hypothetical protein
MSEGGRLNCDREYTSGRSDMSNAQMRFSSPLPSKIEFLKLHSSVLPATSSHCACMGRELPGSCPEYSLPSAASRVPASVDERGTVTTPGGGHGSAARIGTVPLPIPPLLHLPVLASPVQRAPSAPSRSAAGWAVLEGKPAASIMNETRGTATRFPRAPRALLVVSHRWPIFRGRTTKAASVQRTDSEERSRTGGKHEGVRCRREDPRASPPAAAFLCAALCSLPLSPSRWNLLPASPVLSAWPRVSQRTHGTDRLPPVADAEWSRPPFPSPPSPSAPLAVHRLPSSEPVTG